MTMAKNTSGLASSAGRRNSRRASRQKRAEDVAHAGSPSAGSTVAPLAALAHRGPARGSRRASAAGCGGWSAPPSRRAGNARPGAFSSCATPFVEGGEGFIEDPQGGASRYRRASATRRCWPAERVWQGTSSKPRRPTSARACQIASRLAGWSALQSQVRFSSALSRPLIPAAWPIHSRLRASSPRCSASSPAVQADFPAVGCIGVGQQAQQGWSCRCRWDHHLQHLTGGQAQVEASNSMRQSRSQASRRFPVKRR